MDLKGERHAYYPILRVAMDERIMGEHATKRSDTPLGAIILVLIVVAAAGALPLMIATNSGRPYERATSQPEALRVSQPRHLRLPQG